MKSVWTKLSIFLLLGVGASIYLWRTFSDEQTVLRRTDALLETASVQRLTLGDPEKPLETFRSIVADPLALEGNLPVAADSYSREEATALLKRFRESVGGSRIRRLETTVTFPRPGEALVEALVETDLSWGRGTHSVDRFRARLEFRDSPEGWMLTRAAFHRPPGK